MYYTINNMVEKHKLGTGLRDLILGGQDGLVNVLGIVLGVSAANGSHAVIIAASLAAAFAESISMGAVAYTSTLAEKDHYESEKNRELKEIEDVPEVEKEEIRQIYGAKGFSGKLLEDIVATICSNKENWVKIMMDEELHLAPVDTKRIFVSSMTVGGSAMVGSLVPIVPFFILPQNQAVIVSLIASSIALFLVGVYKAVSSVGSWWKSGLQLLLIGMGSALAGFIIGKIFNAP